MLPSLPLFEHPQANLFPSLSNNDNIPTAAAAVSLLSSPPRFLFFLRPMNYLPLLILLSVLLLFYLFYLSLLAAFAFFLFEFLALYSLPAILFPLPVPPSLSIDILH
jgi:hypothetical protein